MENKEILIEENKIEKLYETRSNLFSFVTKNTDIIDSEENKSVILSIT